MYCKGRYAILEYKGKVRNNRADLYLAHDNHSKNGDNVLIYKYCNAKDMMRDKALFDKF